MQRIACNRPSDSRGFTLVEVLAALVVLGVLLSVALPTFTGSLRKSRRSDAVAALSAVQQAQERWRSVHPAYASNSDLTVAASASQPGLGLSASTASGHYGIAISDNDPIGYTVTASVTSTGAQAGDSACASMGVRVSGGNIKYAGAAGDIDWAASNPDPNRCWNR
jgi:type IV pilus assembly protein PilE